MAATVGGSPRDSPGNIQSITTNGVTRSTPTSSGTNRLTGAVSYDNRGNLTSYNGALYDYDPLNAMWRYRNGSQEHLHFYTADDERLWTYTVGPEQRNRWTLRDLDGKVLRQYNYERVTAVWTVDRDHVYRDGQLLAAHTAHASPNHLVHYHPDHLGTPRQITNASGIQVGFHVYYPFGEEASDTNQNGERMKYTGHERDLHAHFVPNAGQDDLDYMHARYCSPVTGRFLSIDPVGGNPRAPQSWNRYAYVLGSPLKYTDPYGLAATCFGFVCGEEILVTGEAPYYDAGGFNSFLSFSAFFHDLGSLGGGFSRGFGFLDVSTASSFYQGNLERFAAEDQYLLAYLNFAVDELFVPDSQGELGVELALAGIPGPFDNAAFAAAKGLRVSFGHGAGHLVGTQLAKEVVEAAVQKQVAHQARRASASGSFWGRVAVGNKVVEYRAYTLPNGRIHVGTYYVVK